MIAVSCMDWAEVGDGETLTLSDVSLLLDINGYAKSFRGSMLSPVLIVWV